VISFRPGKYGFQRRVRDWRHPPVPLNFFEENFPNISHVDRSIRLDSTPGGGQLGRGCPLPYRPAKMELLEKDHKNQMFTTLVPSRLRVICATHF
jgi:hypothetical protein